MFEAPVLSRFCGRPHPSCWHTRSPRISLLGFVLTVAYGGVYAQALALGCDPGVVLIGATQRFLWAPAQVVGNLHERKLAGGSFARRESLVRSLVEREPRSHVGEDALSEVHPDVGGRDRRQVDAFVPERLCEPFAVGDLEGSAHMRVVHGLDPRIHSRLLAIPMGHRLERLQQPVRIEDVFETGYVVVLDALSHVEVEEFGGVEGARVHACNRVSDVSEVLFIGDAAR